MATVASIMTGVTPDPAYTGAITADDFVFAVDFEKSGSVEDYLVADNGITDATGALEAQTQDSTYLRRGQVTTKTGTTRTFSVSGERIAGDTFQDAVLDYAVTYGTGADVVFPYVYYNWRNGVGEAGTVSVQVSDDFAGAASEMAQFAIEFTSTEKPTLYNYTATP